MNEREAAELRALAEKWDELKESGVGVAYGQCTADLEEWLDRQGFRLPTVDMTEWDAYTEWLKAGRPYPTKGQEV